MTDELVRICPWRLINKLDVPEFHNFNGENNSVRILVGFFSETPVYVLMDGRMQERRCAIFICSLTHNMDKKNILLDTGKC
jgi:hypothetical protein